MLHETSKRGPRKHVSGFSMIVSCYHACTRVINEVIIELYRNCVLEDVHDPGMCFPST